MLVALLRQIGQAEVQLTAAAAYQAKDQSGHSLLTQRILLHIGPQLGRRPPTAEHIRVRQGLVQPFPPTLSANVEPELHVHRVVGQQIGVGRGQQHSILWLVLPGLQVLRGDDPA